MDADTTGFTSSHHWLSMKMTELSRNDIVLLLYEDHLLYSTVPYIPNVVSSSFSNISGGMEVWVRLLYRRLRVRSAAMLRI
jgi:hypothetical protein